jgi:CRP/FNR family transcriptional regulator, anaerobic regulatory protein
MAGDALPALIVPTKAALPVLPIRDLHAHCGDCGSRDLCLPAGLSPEGIRQVDGVVANRVRVRKRESLYRAGEPFAALYAIRLGTFKTLVLTDDGREQITGFHMPGDLLGLDSVGRDRYGCQAVALEDGEVCVLPFNRLDELAHEVPLLQRNLYRSLTTDICRDQNMLLLLGSRCAEERVALFLLNLAEAFRERGYSSSEFVLRMSREEIASYLGLQLETVSRLFSHLQEDGLIQVQGRAIKLLDMPALKRRGGAGSSRQRQAL